MLIFSPKARQLVDEAVMLLDQSQRRAWLAWSSEHDVSRGAGDQRDNGKGALPPEVVNAVLTALEAKKDRLRQRLRTPNLSEDEISDLDNDLTHVRSVERAVYENLNLHRAAV